MSTARVYDSLLGTPLDVAPEWEQTARTSSWRGWDTISGTLHGIAAVRDQLRPRATQFATFDDSGACTFNGFLTKVARTPGSDAATIAAASWRAWPSQVHATDDVAWMLTDPAFIAAACWCASATPIVTAPTGFTYAPTTTELLMGSPATEDNPAAPVRAAWYLETNFGDLLAAVNAATGLIETETHRPDYRRTPFTTVTATWRPEPRRDGAVFALGENIAEPPTIEWEPEHFATEHLFLGEGEGPTRAHAITTTMVPNAPRSTALHKDTTTLRDTQTLQQAAPSAAFAAARTLPFTTLRVVRHHAYAPEGTYAPGSLVTVDLGGDGRYPDALVTAITHGRETEADVELTLEYWGGW